MATLKNSNYIGGASSVRGPRRLLKNVAGGRTLIETAGADIPVAVSSCAWAHLTDPASTLDYEILEIGKVYELVASDTIASGARVCATTEGRAVTQAGPGISYFIALDADGSENGKTFSAVFTGPRYHAS